MSPLVIAAKPAVDVRATAAAPVIDGRLDDAAWRDAAVITAFRQVSPVENGEPTERTEALVTYDADHLYVAFRCYDRQADKIVAKEMQHDRDTGSDDIVRFAIDTFHRQRDGYYFALTAAGGKHEGLVQNKDWIVTEWDSIWDGRVTRDAAGWYAEFAIPLKSLAFDPRTQVWGFDVERIIRRNQERDRWSGMSRVKSIGSLPDVGELRGLTGLRQGLGLELRPYSSLTYRPQRDRTEDPAWKLKPGFDFTWHATPSLAATLTVNTDFAETEVDDRQVNLSRFSLFFPEKRDFFLQDAALFSFGNIDYSPYPYFSRRIGLSVDGTPVDILAGVKVAGRLDRVTIGLLDVQVDSTPTVQAKNLLVARTAFQVSSEASVGLLATNGDPRFDGTNRIAGADFNYVNTNLPNHKTLHVHSWVVGSDSAMAGGRDHAEALQVYYPNEPWNFYSFIGRYGERYDPGLGFAPRVGIYEYVFNPQYTWRKNTGLIRMVSTGMNFYAVTNLHGRIDTEEYDTPWIVFENAPRDWVESWHTHSRDRLVEPFEIHPGVVIPAGDYQWERYHAGAGTSRSRAVSLEASIDERGFYTGRRHDYTASIEWRASRFFFARASWQVRQIRLREGGFDVHVGQVRLNTTFSPDLSLNTVLQYDNQSRQIGLNARLKWIVRPGNELFLVWNQDYDADSEHLHARAAALTTKAAWTFRW